MAIGDVTNATGVDPDLWYVDTGMYEVREYGAVYVIDAPRPAVVDTGIGTNYERVVAAVERAGVAHEDLAAILVTHVHLDHAGGAGFLADAFPNAAVYVHERGARHLAAPDRLWAGTKRAVGDQIDFYTEPRPVPEDRIRTVGDGDRIDLGDRELAVVHAPGHAPHQVVFHDPTMDAVFTADAAGIYTPSTDEVHVTSPPPNFQLEAALDDVDRLRELDPSWLLYAHFGPARRDGRLEAYAETLTEWVAAVDRARSKYDDRQALIDHFVETVATPDVWGDRKAEAEVAMNVRGVLTSFDRRGDE